MRIQVLEDATLLAASLILLASVPGFAHAADPSPVAREIPYRGVLESSGQPVDSDIAMRFELYATDTSASPLWQSPVVTVPVRQGLFTVVLGQTFGPGAMTALPDSIFEAGTAYLSITVAGLQLSGRQRIGTAPYAVRSQSADNGSPPGTVVAFAGEVLPQGWLLCDGAPYPVSAYPVLAGVLGTSWGGTAGVSFKVPDLRGQFLRGAHGTAQTPDPVLDRPVGQVQAGTFESHAHSISDPGHSHTTGFSGGGDLINGPYHFTARENPNVSGPWTTASALTGIVTTQTTGGAETRPTNAAVNFIIKY